MPPEHLLERKNRIRVVFNSTEGVVIDFVACQSKNLGRLITYYLVFVTTFYLVSGFTLFLVTVGNSFEERVIKDEH